MTKNVKLAENLDAGKIAAGCMRIASLSDKDADALVNCYIENGTNLFDHADIYGRGKSEEVFSGVLKRNKSLRNKIILQTKCGIVPSKMFDFSYAHIMDSVEGSLRRLKAECIDILLLHRPDALVEPEEVAKAFTELKSSGKAKRFGVSNHNPFQMQLLSKYLPEPLIINQLQISAAFTPMIDAGLNVNMQNDAAINRDGGILDYCRLNGITIQAWSPMQYGFFKGVFLGSEQYPKLNAQLDALAEKYSVSAGAISLAFILRHPAKWQVILGTTKPERVRELSKAAEINLSREEWYSIYLAAGNILP